MDFQEIVEQHEKTGADVTIAAKAMPKECVHGLGVMRVADDLTIAEFVEKPTDPKVVQSLVVGASVRSQIKHPKPGQDYCLASMGIYVFTGKVLKDAMQTSAMDFGREIIPSLLGKKKLYSFVFDGYWEDIGTVGSFFEANLLLTTDNPPFDLYHHAHPIFTHLNYLPPPKFINSSINRAIVAAGTIINGAKIDQAIIGVRSHIGEGTSFERVVMMGSDDFETERQLRRNRERGVLDIGVGKNCSMKNAIIDKNARIGDNVRLSPDGKPDLWQQGDLYVRDGVIIVAKNGVVPSGTVV
jgi:glucose-1-phosphate adenylyltransferase